MNLIDTIKLLNTDWKDILLSKNNIYINNKITSFFLELQEISDYLKSEEDKYNNDIKIFPPKNKIFNCFSSFNFSETKVVILGQDPYINENEANGFCFSVNNNIKCPPSLRNIFKELNNEFGIQRTDTDLSDWCNQGVLLLNTSLTVLYKKSNSHSKIWKKITDLIIKYISDNLENIIFVLWGNNAKSKKELINIDKHHIFESVHPSPLSASRGFFGNNHFVKINELLIKLNKSEIKWV